MKPGTLVLVIGPSGAGKDTLIAAARDALAGDARFLFPRRHVTRASDSHEPVEERTREAFAREQAAGGFALSWAAHGQLYGVPRDIEAALARARRWWSMCRAASSPKRSSAIPAWWHWR